MKELKIFDKVEGESYLISLGELIKRLEQLDASLTDSEWEIINGAYGYGELICSIEDKLKRGQQCIIDGKTIFPILKSEEEYFYNVCMKKIGIDIEIGVFDSTNLFIRSNSYEFLNKIKNYFNDAQIVV